MIVAPGVLSCFMLLKTALTLLLSLCLLHITCARQGHFTAVLRETSYTACSSDWSDNGNAGFLGGHSPAAAEQLQVYSCQDCCGQPWGVLGTLHGVARVHHGLLCHVCLPGDILCPFGSWQRHPRDQDIPQRRAHQRCNYTHCLVMPFVFTMPHCLVFQALMCRATWSLTLEPPASHSMSVQQLCPALQTLIAGPSLVCICLTHHGRICCKACRMQYVYALSNCFGALWLV